MQKYTQLGMFDAAAADKYQKAQDEAEMMEWLRTRVSPRAFKKWKAKYDREKEWLERPRQPLRPDLQAYVDELREKVMASAKPFLAAEYAILGLERGATKREIKNAYRRMARKLHPDKGGSEEDMKALNAAYKRLLAATKE